MDDHYDPWYDETSDELQAMIKPELGPGERLLWASRADRRSPTSEQNSAVIGVTWGFGLATAAILSFLTAASLDRWRYETIQTFLIVVGLISGILSFFILVTTVAGAISRGREGRRRSGRLYALTDSRAIIWDPLPRSTAVTVHTFSRGTIEAQNLRRLQYPDGSGDILFRKELHHPPGFLGVADVRRVEELIRRFLIERAPEARPEPHPSHFDL